MYIVIIMEPQIQSNDHSRIVWIL